MSNRFPSENQTSSDSENEIFWGPITEKEEKIRRRLPRKTLQPEDITETQRLGMDFRESEAYSCRSSEVEKEEAKSYEVSTDTSDSQFDSCNSSLINSEKESRPSFEGGLDDSLDKIEKMLALAEKLEHEEKEKLENVPVVKEELLEEKENQQPEENATFNSNFVDNCEEGPVVNKNETLISYNRPTSSASEVSAISTRNITAKTIPETPVKMYLSPSNVKRQPHLLKPLKSSVESPVGLYIRSQPEPILIQNVKTTPGKLTNKSTGSSKSSIEYWASRETKTNPVVHQEPVLPTVLHRAPAAAMVYTDSEKVPKLPDSWTRGKIGKLLSNSPQPVILEHQGRIKIPKVDAEKSPLVVMTPQRSVSPNRDSEDGLMEISVLEPMFCSPKIKDSSIKRRLNMN